MKPDVSIKGRCTHSDMTGEVGGFQTPRVCLQAFPSFLPYPVSLHFSRGLWFLLLCSETCTETLATQAMPFCYFWINILFAVSVPHVDVTRAHILFSYEYLVNFSMLVVALHADALPMSPKCPQPFRNDTNRRGHGVPDLSGSLKMSRKRGTG